MIKGEVFEKEHMGIYVFIYIVDEPTFKERRQNKEFDRKVKYNL